MKIITKTIKKTLQQNFFYYPQDNHYYRRQLPPQHVFNSQHQQHFFQYQPLHQPLAQPNSQILYIPKEQQQNVISFSSQNQIKNKFVSNIPQPKIITSTTLLPKINKDVNTFRDFDLPPPPPSRFLPEDQINKIKISDLFFNQNHEQGTSNIETKLQFPNFQQQQLIEQQQKAKQQFQIDQQRPFGNQDQFNQQRLVERQNQFEQQQTAEQQNHFEQQRIAEQQNQFEQQRIADRQNQFKQQRIADRQNQFEQQKQKQIVLNPPNNSNKVSQKFNSQQQEQKFFITTARSTVVNSTTLTDEQTSQIFETKINNPSTVFLKCCKRKRVDKLCESRCNFDNINKKVLTQMFLGTDSCPQSYGLDLFSCAAQDGDHTPCCKAKKVQRTSAGDKCLAFCKMTPDSQFQADASYLPCWAVLNDVKNCFKESILNDFA